MRKELPEEKRLTELILFSAETDFLVLTTIC